MTNPNVPHGCELCGWWVCARCGWVRPLASRFAAQSCSKCDGHIGHFEPVTHTAYHLRRDHDEEIERLRALGRSPVEQPRTQPPVVRTFESEEALETYVSAVNEGGESPRVAIVDSHGTPAVAFVAAPGGDDYYFGYDGFDYDPDTGLRHCHDCAECEPDSYCRTWARGWKPAFPVAALVPDTHDRAAR